MKHRLSYFLLAWLFLFSACSGPTSAPATSTSVPLPTQEVEVVLQFSSSSFEPGSVIPRQYTCRGADISPELSWGEPPEGTQSFAIIMDDPDAPSGTYVHWVIFNIPGSARGLPEALPRQEKLPDGSTQGLMSGHNLGYYGPCPPSGTHRYFFKLYALDSMLELGSDASAEDLMKAMAGRMLVNTELVGISSK